MSEDFPKIYFLDEEESQRNFLRNALRHLFAATHEIEPLPVLPQATDYLQLIDSANVAAVFVDQQLDQTGIITGFTGVKLAETLRAHFKEMPIYVVTGHAIEGELNSEGAGATDAIVPKPSLVIGDSRSLAFKQQFLRRVGLYDQALTTRQARFRELQIKRLQSSLDQGEQNELAHLEAERLMPTASAESATEKKIKEETAELGELLKKVEQLIKPK